MWIDHSSQQHVAIDLGFFFDIFFASIRPNHTLAYYSILYIYHPFSLLDQIRNLVILRIQRS